ncbi:hypothetical protein TGRUB_247620 [Toxoplasma gondii RUB]|uniref:Uncharacterized protein n=1 Tax=Toxoplasma gondii RUB TaxID=935652 RepID=A0A086M6H7_TOXGO|nr:hypothetical protein TGRUB_247620 [Toxoplasma gondii RUB]
MRYPPPANRILQELPSSWVLPQAIPLRDCAEGNAVRAIVPGASQQGQTMQRPESHDAAVCEENIQDMAREITSSLTDAQRNLRQAGRPAATNGFWTGHTCTAILQRRTGVPEVVQSRTRSNKRRNSRLARKSKSAVGTVDRQLVLIIQRRASTESHFPVCMKMNLSVHAVDRHLRPPEGAVPRCSSILLVTETQEGGCLSLISFPHEFERQLKLQLLRCSLVLSLVCVRQSRDTVEKSLQ